MSRPKLDPVAAGEAQLLEDPAVRRRLAGQGLAHPGQFGEEQFEHGTGHQLGDPPAAGGVAVQRPGVEALDEGDVVGGEQRAEEPGHEGRGRVGHVGIEEGDDVAAGGRPAPPPWPGPCRPAPPGPATTVAPASWACSAVSSREPSSRTMTSSTSPFPPLAARKGWTTARTTEPTVEPSSRAGMQTETVRPVRALGLEHGRGSGNRPCSIGVRHAPDSSSPPVR